MKQPDKWKDAIDPFSIKFNNFKLLEVLGYPHARNDVFYCKGIYENKETFCFIKYASQKDSNVLREITTIKTLNFEFIPKIIDYDESGKFIVTKEINGERLSYILQTTKEKSIDYMFEYGKTLAQIHSTPMVCENVTHRKFFDIPSLEYLNKYKIDFIYNHLTKNKPEKINNCFCHGDFHYANVLWKDKKLVGVLDWDFAELATKNLILHGQ